MHATARLAAFATGFDGSQRRLARAGVAIFLVLGAVQALYGPALPSVRASFALGTATAGWTIGAHYSGAVAGVLLSFLMEARLRARLGLAIGVALTAAGSLTFGAFHAWPWVLIGVFCIGLGYGILVVAINGLFADAFGERGTAAVILVNAMFGLGAVLGPLLYGLFCSGNFRPAFLAIGIGTLLILPLVWALPTSVCAARPTPPVTQAGRFPWVRVAFVVLFALYVGIEADTSGWMATHLTFQGYTSAAAAGLTAAFWTALTAGRLFSVPISLRLSPVRMIAGALVGVIALALAANAADLTPVAYVVIGLLLAPIFPVGFAWMNSSVAGARGVAPLALLGSLAGGLIFPVGVGRIIGASSPNALPLALAALAALCLLVSLSLPRLIRASAVDSCDGEEAAPTTQLSASVAASPAAPASLRNRLR